MASIPSLPENPQVGDPRLVSDLNSNDAALLAAVNSIDDSQIGTDLTDAVLASPNNGVVKLLCPISVMFNGPWAAADYFATQSGTPLALGASITSAESPPQTFYRTGNTVSGKTAYLRFIGTVYTNGTSPASTLSIGLNALTACGGGAGVIVPTFNPAEALTTGISALTANMALNFSTANLPDVTAANTYAVTFNLSAITAANSVTMVVGGVYILHA